MTYEKQPVPQVNVASASDDLSWNLTAADYKAWRKAFYADEGSEEIELNMLNAILKTSDRLAWVGEGRQSRCTGLAGGPSPGSRPACAAPRQQNEPGAGAAGRQRR